MNLLAMVVLAALSSGCAGTREIQPLPTLQLEQQGDSSTGVATFELTHVSVLSRDDIAIELDNVTLDRAVDCAEPMRRVWSWCPPPGVPTNALAAGGTILAGARKKACP